MRKFLYEYSADLKCKLIYTDGKPYMERYLVRQWGTGHHLHLHRFVNGDAEHHLHDHPWWAFSIVLAGWYMEECLSAFCMKDGALINPVRKIRLWNWIPRSRFHRVSSAAPETWTLVLTGPRSKGWGFLKWLTKGDTRENMLVYHNPYEQDKAEAWSDAPVGRNAGRELLNSYLIPDQDDTDGGWSSEKVTDK